MWRSVVCSHRLAGSFTRKLHHQVIVKPVFRNPLPTRRFPSRLFRHRIQNDMVRERCAQKLSGHQHIHAVDDLRSSCCRGSTEIDGYARKQSIPVGRLGEALAASLSSRSRPRIGYRRNMMQYQPRASALPPDTRSAIEPDRLLFPVTVIGYRRYDEVT